MPDATPTSTPTSDGPVDVAVVGGSAAGLAAALQLVRSRRSVVVVDAGEPRNAPAEHMHGYLGRDGQPPGELLAAGRAEVEGYGGRILHGRAGRVRTEGRGFEIGVDTGEALVARRLVLATGLVDELPDIPGVADRWGRSVIHCPYCHGWEVRDQAIAVIGTGPMAGHQALLFRQLSDRVSLIVHDGDGPPRDERLRLEARGITIVDGPVAEIVGTGDEVSGVRLAEGSVVEADAVVVAPVFHARTDLAGQLGIETSPTPLGTGVTIPTDERGRTSVTGVYAAGNATDASAQVLHAAAQGSRVGAFVNFDLVEEDVADTMSGTPGNGAADWDRRYASRTQLFSGNVNASLAACTDDLEVGTALDLACGEGADAIWLTGAGWDVTATDISPIAIDRARAAADREGRAVDWLVHDLGEGRPTEQRFDLVTTHYPAFPKSTADRSIPALLDSVAPGGTLLFVTHDFEHHDHHPAFDPSDYVMADDLVAVLDDTWTVEVLETRPRTPPPGHDGPAVPDRILRARRAA